jgi:hypothetical protein
MCTLTWWRGEEGAFEVFFNRDEKKTRSQAEKPRLYEVAGTKFLSPRDPDGGGTWMLANEHGVVLCLLNRWHEEVGGEKAWLSRGQLVWGLAGAKSARSAVEALKNFDLSQRKPFALWAFDEESVLGLDWSGGVLAAAEERMPVTSSSHCFQEVSAARKKCFARISPSDPEELQRYHESAGVESSAFTVRMSRPDAQTMSRSRVRVDGRELWWEYREEQPDLAGVSEKVVVSLSRDCAVDRQSSASQVGPR